MTNGLPTFPLLNRPPSPPDPRDLLAAFDGWSIAELMRNERFAQGPDESLPPTSSVGARDETAAAWQPDWLTNAKWQATPATIPWPEPPPPMPRSATSEDPFGRAALRTKRSVISDARRRPPMGSPFLDGPPQDYPSHLGPVPQSPDWEQAVTGPTNWSPLAEPPRATDWVRTTTVIDDAAAAEEARRAWARRLGQWDWRGTQEYEPPPPLLAPPAEPSIAAEEARRAAAMRVGQWRQRNQRPYEGYTAPPPAPPAGDGDLAERARLNLLDSYYRGSLFGAARLALMKMLNGLPDGGISPATKRVQDELRKEYQQILADLGRYDRMRGFQSPSEFGAAALGRLGGAVLSPEGLASLGTLRRGGQAGGMLANAGWATLENGLLFGGVDPAVQGLNIVAGVQDQYNPLRTLTAAGVAAAFGGGAQLGTEVFGKLAARWLPGFGDTARGSSVEVRVFRVEGEPNLRIDIFETGDVIVRDNANALFLNFGSRPRAEEFLARRMSQGMKDAVIKSFNVPRGFLEDVRAAAVKSRESKEFPGRPLVVDETRAPDQFGLRGQWIDRLRDAIIQGSGRIER